MPTVKYIYVCFLNNKFRTPKLSQLVLLRYKVGTNPASLFNAATNKSIMELTEIHLGTKPLLYYILSLHPCKKSEGSQQFCSIFHIVRPKSHFFMPRTLTENSLVLPVLPFQIKLKQIFFNASFPISDQLLPCSSPLLH